MHGWSHSDGGDAWPAEAKGGGWSHQTEDVSQVIHGREDTVTLLKGRCKSFWGEHKVSLARSVEAPGGLSR
jgi:hypothetical protein